MVDGERLHQLRRSSKSWYAINLPIVPHEELRPWVEALQRPRHCRHAQLKRDLTGFWPDVERQRPRRPDWACGHLARARIVEE
jgi:hypothetical protein